MRYPYNTGRVRIGIAYIKLQRPRHDADALRLQDALLHPRRMSLVERIASFFGGRQ